MRRRLTKRVDGELRKTKGSLAGAGLMVWGISVGLALMSMQAPALVTGHLEAVTPRDVAYELVEKLGYTQSGPCAVIPVKKEGNRVLYGRFFRAECQGTKLFLKFHDKPVAQAFLPAISLLESSPLLSASILQPIAEFSFRREGRDPDTQWYCSAYPWVPGDTLRDVLNKMHQPEQEAEYLTGIYRQLGRLLGEMGGAGLVDADKPLEEMQSRLIHSDVHVDNLKITPDNRVVILDIDSFTGLEKPLPVQKGFFEGFLQLIVWAGDHDFFADTPRSSAWLRVLPAFAEALLTSYCQTLVGKDKATACVSQIAEMAAGQVLISHNHSRRYLPEVEPVVSNEEMKRRVDMVFGPLR
ncbi:MAG: hypothetical protein OXC07_02160 [Kistimonas sp.]|nr:hypothetical protein [Kistimonas sp.]